MKYYFWVLGCAMNYSDAERIAAVFDLLGYEKTEEETQADFIITVACSVRQKAIDRIHGKLKSWKKLKKKNPNLKLILTGCVLEKDRKQMAEVFDVVFEINDLGKLPSYIGEILDEEKVEVLGKSGEYLGLVPSYESHFRAYVPIMTGCNNFCSYCAVPYTRGREKSRPKDEVISEIKNLVKKSYKEITLLGQNVNSYQFGFAELLKSLDEIEGDHRIYYYSNHPKDMSEELISTLPKLKHFPPYIHFPLQSGNDEIIRKMNRRYTKESYLALVGKIKKALPEITLTTDIIVGFPGETEAAFQDTVDVMKEAKFDMAFIAQYSPRSGTVSAKLPDDVPKTIKKLREKTLVGILSQTANENNQKIVGTVQKVLIDGVKKGKYFGRTAGFKVVEITKIDTSTQLRASQKLVLGQFIDVEIKSATAWKLFGSL